MLAQETWEEAEVERLAEPLQEIAAAQKSIAGSLTVLAWVVSIWGLLTLAGNVAAALFRTHAP